MTLIKMGLYGGRVVTYLGFVILVTVFLHSDTGFVSQLDPLGRVFYALCGLLGTLLGLGMQHWSKAMTRAAEDNKRLIIKVRETSKSMDHPSLKLIHGRNAAQRGQDRMI